MIAHQSFNSCNFYARHTAATSEPYRIEPKLSDPIIPLDVNMAGLVTITCVEKESVRPDFQDRRHSVSLTAIGSRLSHFYPVSIAPIKFDRLTNSPGLIDNATKITCPILFIRGDQEPKESYPAAEFAKNCPGPCEVAIVPNCDHFYVGAEDNVSKIVTEWLKKTLG